jgi:hypothetical protein
VPRRRAARTQHTNNTKQAYITKSPRSLKPTAIQVRPSSRIQLANCTAIRALPLKTLAFVSSHGDQTSKANRVLKPLRCDLWTHFLEGNHQSTMEGEPVSTRNWKPAARSKRNHTSMLNTQEIVSCSMNSPACEHKAEEPLFCR